MFLSDFMMSWYRVYFSVLVMACTDLLLEADVFVLCGHVVEFDRCGYVDA